MLPKKSVYYVICSIFYKQLYDATSTFVLFHKQLDNFYYFCL